MSTHTITMDPRTEADLKRMSETADTDAGLMASRLLARAVRPRPVYDIKQLKAYAAENEAEELALADSEPVHHAELLAQEGTG